MRDVIGIGNAIVDILAYHDEPFLEAHNLRKSYMALVNEPKANELLSSIKSAKEVPGGSAANTLAGLASLGGTGSFIGKVQADQLGEGFTRGLASVGIDFSTARSRSGVPTGTSIVIVTDDGERSMATYLGACLELSPDDIDEHTINGHKVTYLEGYIWDGHLAKQATEKAAQIAKADGQRVALTLSDSLCVDRHRDSFVEFIAKYVDLLFANEDEILSLYQSTDIMKVIEGAQQICNMIAVTQGAKGSIIAERDTIHYIKAEPTNRVLDTTGAGDLYAAGFLFGLTHGFNAQNCGRIGAIAASEIISHLGARPETDLSHLISHLQ